MWVVLGVLLPRMLLLWAQIADVVGLSVTGANVVGLSVVGAFAVGSFVVVRD